MRKVRIDHEKDMHSVQFEPYVYVAGYHSTVIVMDEKEHAVYRNATIADLVKNETERVRAALKEHDLEEAAATADYEGESKMDVLNTEAWLDSAPSYGGSE